MIAEGTIPIRIQQALNVIFDEASGREWYFQKLPVALNGYTPDAIVSFGDNGQDRVMELLLTLIAMWVSDTDKIRKKEKI